jgi:hypothetical protein
VTEPDSNTESSGPATVIAAAVSDVVSPSALGQSNEGGTPLDLPQVIPAARASKTLLWLGIGTGVGFAALAVAVGMHSVQPELWTVQSTGGSLSTANRGTSTSHEHSLGVAQLSSPFLLSS